MGLSLCSKTEKINRFAVFLVSFLVLGLPLGRAEQGEVPAASDTGAVARLNERAMTFWSSKPDSTIILATQALEISIQQHDLAGQMRTLHNLGVGYYEKGNYNEAVQSYNRAIALAERLGDNAYNARIRSNLAMPYLALGAHDEALENLSTALDIAEKNHLTNTIAHITHNIGMVYHYQSKHDQAIAFYEKSQKLYESNGDTTRSTFILGNIAHLYLKEKDFQKARTLYLQSLALAEKLDNKKAIGNALQSLGAFFMEQDDPKTARSYFLRAKETLESTGEQTEYLRLLDNLATCYLKLGDTDTAYSYATQSYELATRQQQFYYIQTSAHRLSDMYEKSGDYRKALDYFKKANLASDSVQSQQNKEALVRMEEKYKYQKDQEQATLLYDAKLKKKNQWLYLAIGAVCVLTVIALFFARTIRQKRRLNRILKETNDFFEEQNALLEASNHFKEQLISLVAHDVRHPIASLQNVPGNLEYNPDTDQYSFGADINSIGDYFFPDYVKPKIIPGPDTPEPWTYQTPTRERNGNPGDPCALVAPAGTWRLPTEAEIETLISRTGAHGADMPEGSAIPWNPARWSDTYSGNEGERLGTFYGIQNHPGADANQYLFILYAGEYNTSNNIGGDNSKGYYLISGTTDPYKKYEIGGGKASFGNDNQISNITESTAVQIRCVRN